MLKARYLSNNVFKSDGIRKVHSPYFSKYSDALLGSFYPMELEEDPIEARRYQASKLANIQYFLSWITESKRLRERHYAKVLEV
jgi:hypothetical protein